MNRFKINRDGMYVTGFVWDYLKTQDTKIAETILKALNYDVACFIMYDNEEVQIEKVYSSAYVPNYLFDYLKRNNEKIVKFINNKITKVED